MMDSKARTRTQIQTPTQTQTKLRTMKNNNVKRSSSSNSDTYDHSDSPHSALRSQSPLRSDLGDPDSQDSPPFVSPRSSPLKNPFEDPNSKSLVSYSEKYRQSSAPGKMAQKPTVVTLNKAVREEPNSKPIVPYVENYTQGSPAPGKAAQNPPTVTLNRVVKEEGAGPKTETTRGGEEGRSAVVAAIQRRWRSDETVKVANLGFRLSEVVLCLISFSVMAADKTQGWSGDSFDRYREYRYCLSMNVIGFVYSAFQAYDVAYYLGTGKHVINHHLRRPFDFFMDQVLAYLLISASSAAATRVDDWVSNWGKDQFTIMASASVAMSFLAFIAFACSSIISGYNLCNRDAT